MEQFLYYLLRATITTALFYGFYKLLFSKTTFYAANRVALSVILVAIVAVPLFHYNLLPEKQPEATPIMEMPIAIGMTDFVIQEEPQPTPIEIPWQEILTAIYIGGVAFFLLRYIIGLTQLVQIIHTSHNRHTLSDGSILCITNKKMNPCSWFNYIILSAEDHSAENRAMIGHEQAHVHLRHSADRLLFDLMVCLFWFNPFAWLLRRELQSVHEFQADEGVLTKGIDAKTYQLLLIRKSVGDIKFAMANDFLQRDLQKRITMMMKNKTSTAKKWGYALSLPLLVLIMVVLSVPKLNATIVEQQEENEIENTINSQDGEEVIVSGSVRGDEGMLPGVSIIIKGSSTGTMTNPEGNFTIKAQKGDILSFSYVGYGTYEYKVTEAHDNLTVVLEQEAIIHSDVEVVVDSEDGKIIAAKIADEEVTISGRVKDEEGFMPGVTVLIKGSSKGTVTDMNGRFTIKVNKGDVLVFSYVGYASTEQAVEKTKSGVIIDLEEEEKMMDEIVVVGYEGDEGEQKRTDRLQLKGNIESIQLRRLPKGDSPLYVVDGVVQTKGFDASSINPEDIDNISVLKNESAIELYGEEGKNGVIHIETKENKSTAYNNKTTTLSDQFNISENEKVNALIDYDKIAFVIGDKLAAKEEVEALKPEQMKGVNIYSKGDKLKELQKKFNTDKESFMVIELK
ncbi:MAG: TonB-dependent receptor plug domain-containing protein [Bacteroidales bacterium]|nr:TonB-dependent receptor plug domain-containing protein [Bacteroidales bacterium]